MLHSVVGALLLGHVLVFGTCATTPEKSPRTSAAGFQARGWSEAGRRAEARLAWGCSDQTPPQLEKKERYGRVHVGGRRSAEWARRCSYPRLLCQQIHRGAQATDDEKAECSAYESAHGRVSGR